MSGPQSKLRLPLSRARAHLQEPANISFTLEPMRLNRKRCTTSRSRLSRWGIRTDQASCPSVHPIQFRIVRWAAFRRRVSSRPGAASESDAVVGESVRHPVLRRKCGSRSWDQDAAGVRAELDDLGKQPDRGERVPAGGREMSEKLLIPWQEPGEHRPIDPRTGRRRCPPSGRR
jgi:hypothetical protein